MSQKEIEIDFQKYWLILKRRWLIVVTVLGVTTAAAAFAGSNRDPLYKADAKLLFESSEQVNSLVGLESGDGNLKPLANQDNPLDTQVEIISSTPIADRVVEQLQIRNGDSELLDDDDFLENLEVKGIPGTDVLRVSYESPDPRLSAAIVNTIMSVFIEENVQANRATAVSAQEFINSELPESEKKVSDIEFELSRFKAKYGIVNLEAESTKTVENLSTVSNSIAELRANLADKNAQRARLQQQLNLNPQQAYAVGIVSESPGVQETLASLQVAQAELAVARTRYRENHPEIARLRGQESALISLLQTRVDQTLGSSQSALPGNDLQAGALEQGLILEFLQLETQTAGLQQQLQELNAAQAAQQTRAGLLPGLERQQRELERRLNAAQTTYETLLDSLQQAQVLENQKVGNARIISYADVPEESTLSSIKLYLLAGGVLGALLGVAAAFIVDLLDQSVKTVKEGQAFYGYPLLGVIPNWRKRKGRHRELELPRILIGEPHRVPIVESYQSLQANLKFSYLDGPLKVIAITSAVSGEGKSEISANLALTLSQLGHSVLLVDADMRSPVQHHVWDIPNAQGLSNFVAGQLPLKQAIVKKTPRLHLLPAGSIPPNPLAIIDSKRMTSLLEACRQTYDYIIVDTPPLLGLADTPTLGRISDGLLIAVRPGITDAASIKAAKQILEQSKQRVLGLAANGIAVNSSGPERYFYHSQEYVAGVGWENVPSQTASGEGSRENGSREEEAAKRSLS